MLSQSRRDDDSLTIQQFNDKKDDAVNNIDFGLKKSGMEIRKVQITGKSTYIISLPKTWVNKVKIRNGNSVILIPQTNGTLLINPKLDETSEVITCVLDIDSSDMETLFRRFIGAYLAGYNIIEITSKERLSSNVRQSIRRMIQNLIGLEIIDESSNSVKVKDLLDPSDLSLTQSLKRMYVITRGMHIDAIEALQTHDLELIEDVEIRDDEVDKFYWMIAKQYNLVLNNMFFADKMGVKPKDVLGYLLVARSIERIADHAKKLASNARSISVKIDILTKIAETSELILKQFDEAMNAFQRNKIDHANDVLNKSKELSKITKQLTNDIFSLKIDAVSIVALAYVIDSLERTRAYVLDIAETAINHQFTMMLP
ncbi:MAG: phosphate uptake regulator PhoU [Candidatus Thermoplasmatota archaeon]